jgi:hypothetical protein
MGGGGGGGGHDVIYITFCIHWGGRGHLSKTLYHAQC